MDRDGTVDIHLKAQDSTAKKSYPHIAKPLSNLISRKGQPDFTSCLQSAQSAYLIAAPTTRFARELHKLLLHIHHHLLRPARLLQSRRAPVRDQVEGHEEQEVGC